MYNRHRRGVLSAQLVGVVFDMSVVSYFISDRLGNVFFFKRLGTRINY